MKSKLILFFKISFVSVIIHLGALTFLLTHNETFRVGHTVITYSTMDFMLTIILFGLIIIGYKFKIIKTFDYLSNYGSRLRRNFLIIIIPLLYSIYVLYRNLQLVFIKGFNREALVLIPTNIFDYFSSSFFYILFPSSIIYNYDKKTKYLIFGGTLFCMIYQLSRAPIFFIGLCTLFLFIFKEKRISKLKLLLTSCFLFVFLGIITIYQGRADSIIDGALNVSEALFRYRSYSFYLSQFVFEISGDVDKILFPFFGWISERLLTVFGGIEQPISTSGSDFVYKFHFVGDYRANVLYPWWAFFYGKFGVIGLFLKMIYCFLLFRILIGFRMPLTLLYFFYILLIYQFVRHPFINASGAYSFISIVLVDIILKYKNAKNCNN